jgi:hypothetical protein
MMRERRRSTGVVLLAGVVALASAPQAHALFGLRGSSSSEPRAAAPPAAPDAAALPRDAAPGASVPASQQQAPGAATVTAKREPDPADPYPFPPSLEDLQDYEAWADETGELHIIRAERLPSGAFSFPEGTTVSVDHTPYLYPFPAIRLFPRGPCHRHLTLCATGAEGSTVNGAHHLGYECDG